MDPARELAELLERRGELLTGADDHLPGSRRGRSRGATPRGASETESETRRCCAPSWRLRSSLRRASSGGLDDAGARGADLRLLLLALGDVDRRRPARATSSGRSRRRSGVAVHATSMRLAVAAQPARLALGHGHAVRGAGDHHRRDVGVVRVDEVEHAPSHDLAVVPAEGSAEGVVDAGPGSRRTRRRR